MGEPLKGKKKQTPNSYKNIRGTCDTVYLEKDIKSAVEWLKKAMRLLGCKHDLLIDKAFEDVK